MARRPTIKDNANRFRKTATILITKELEKKAKELEINLVDDISKTMLQKYKDNVELSYGPRGSRGNEVQNYNKKQTALEKQDRDKFGLKRARRYKKKLTYRPTGWFLDRIYVAHENNVIKIKIEDLPYTDVEGTNKKEKTSINIYNFLRYGTSGGGTYPYAKKTNPETGKEELVWSYNYPTPAHLFEEHTQNYMKSYLLSLKQSIKNGTYSKKRR